MRTFFADGKEHCICERYHVCENKSLPPCCRVVRRRGGNLPPVIGTGWFGGMKKPAPQRSTGLQQGRHLPPIIAGLG
ncbi:MAG: hypothetical protein FWC40_05350 [Proteobacteria bacterium]|nr:hypothetical protein [Pseudomonadota bacterium]